MITINSLTIDLLRIIGEANKICANSLSESFLNEGMKVDVRTFTALMNSYSYKLENILDGKERLSENGTLDRALHDASITKDKAIIALDGMYTVIKNCSNPKKQDILANSVIQFKELVNTYLFAIKLYLEEKFPNIDENTILKRYDLYEIE